MFDRSARIYDLVYGGVKEYDAEARELAGLIQNRNPSASSLLDVACGTGRHLELLRSWFPDAAGVDVEPAMLEVAAARLPGVPFTLADMRTFDLGRTFDAVTCLFSSVGYCADGDELAAAVGRMASHLSTGGVLVIDGWIRPEDWLPGIGLHAIAGEDETVAAARVSRSWRDGERTVLEMRYLIATAEGFEEEQERHVLTLFTDEDYRSAFAAAGLAFEVVGGPMGPSRDRYVAVAG